MALEDDIDLLATQPLLGIMPREALRLVAFAADTRILRAGDILFRKGEMADSGYLIVSGSVMLDARGDGSAGQPVAKAGTLLGEMALFSAVERPATAVAREPSTMSRITRMVMQRVLLEFPEAAVRLHQELSRRVQALSAELAPIAGRIRALD